MPKITLHVEFDSTSEALDFLQLRSGSAGSGVHVADAALPPPPPTAPASAPQPNLVASANPATTLIQPTAPVAPAAPAAQATATAGAGVDLAAAARDAMNAYMEKGRTPEQARAIMNQHAGVSRLRDIADPAKLQAVIVAFNAG